MRDGSSHVLRCLKVWYDLPSDVFHTAVSNIDTFLAKMKVNINYARHATVALLPETRLQKYPTDVCQMNKNNPFSNNP